jgi:hypothetical protein
MDEIKVLHGGVAITYIDHSNKWRVEDNGVWGEKECDSLSDAKEWIDTKARLSKMKGFVRLKALWITGNDVATCEVTSDAGEGYRGSHEVWISYTERSSRFSPGRTKGRSKVGLNVLKAVDLDILESVRSKKKQIEILEKSIEKDISKLKPLKLG